MAMILLLVHADTAAFIDVASARWQGQMQGMSSQHADSLDVPHNVRLCVLRDHIPCAAAPP